MIRVGVVGIGGRMGGEVAKIIVEEGKKFEITLKCGIERKDSDLIGKKIYDVVVYPSLKDCFDKVDIFVEFTNPDATDENLNYLLENPKKYICGTTGLSLETMEKMKNLSKKTAVFYSPNMSLGVNILFSIVENLWKILKDKDYDIEIIEMHHRFKKDAPSGTALKIFEILKSVDKDLKAIFGREGKRLRDKKEVGILSVRGGDIVGEHKIIFSSIGERIELVHVAHSRKAFAYGTLEAIKFLKDKESGFYTTKDILNFS